MLSIPKVETALKFVVFLIILCTSIELIGNPPIEDVPVLYKGRYRPMEAYAKLWLYEIYHQQAILPEHRDAFQIPNGSALEFLWSLSKEGHEKWDNVPLFWIQSADVKSSLGLNLMQSRFSYNELQSVQIPLPEELNRAMQLYTQDPLFLALPDKKSEWHPLSRLKTETRNFTSYSKEQFERIRTAYLDQDSPTLAQELKKGYQSLAGTPYQKAWGKSLAYPSFFQLKAELIYLRYPLAIWCAICYGLAAILLILGWTRSGFTVALISFTLHSALLLMRIFILQRPPVSNMFETIVYVPWVAVLASLVFSFLFKNRVPLIASCAASMALLALLKIADLNPSLENVQAVLDSQYWLIIHVLMIVGSYGVFILSAMLGHFYLAGYMLKKNETPYLASIAKCILHSMYLGTALLIPGTILGGVWAAESWGRFWDWDPKESWAFISACVYLLVIHAFRFHHIHNFGLAVGSIAGVLAISFTWYGVNYILGTGLHSYGFGNGGEIYYYLYLIAEGIFLFSAFWQRYYTKFTTEPTEITEKI